MARPFLELNVDLAEKSLRGYGERLAAGKISIDRFAELCRKEIVTSSVAGFRFANGGPLDERQTALLNNVLREQQQYFERFVGQLRDSTVPLERVPERAAAYAAAPQVAQSYGAVGRAPSEGAPASYRWEGPDGEGTCADCGPRIGRTFDRGWLLINGMPGQVQCKHNCRCHLEPVALEEVA